MNVNIGQISTVIAILVPIIIAAIYIGRFETRINSEIAALKKEHDKNVALDERQTAILESLRDLHKKQDAAEEARESDNQRFCMNKVYPKQYCENKGYHFGRR